MATATTVSSYNANVRFHHSSDEAFSLVFTSQKLAYGRTIPPALKTIQRGSTVRNSK